MDKHLDEKLCEEYPKIFRQRNMSMKVTCMCWGFDCDNGWYWLIDNLCHQLQWDIDHNKYPQLEAVQVKEKFGTLRFYVYGGNAEQNAIISFAESLSGSICERCGSTEEVTQTSGWIQSLCKKCIGDKHV